jgi:hypothetical protein
VQLAVDLDQRHRACIADEHCERGGSEVLADEWPRVRGGGRNGRRTATMRYPEAVDDVLRVDARPHDDPQLRQSGAYLGQLARKRPLSRVELGGPVEECGALGVEGCELVPAMRHASIPSRITNGSHDDPREQVLEPRPGEAPP